MEPFDKRLKERAKQEPFPLPETYAGKVRDTCAALKETNMKENKQKRSYRWLVGVAAALAVFVAIPNVSPAALPPWKKSRCWAPWCGSSPSGITSMTMVTALPTSTSRSWAQRRCRRDQRPGAGLYRSADRPVPDGLRGCGRELPGPGCDLLCGDGQRYLVHSADRCHEDRGQRLQFTRFYHINKATGEAVTLSDLFRPDATTSLSCPRKSCGRWRSRWPRTHP